MNANYNNNFTKTHPWDVWITPFALEKLNQYAAAAQPNEIGGLARLEVNGSAVFVLDVEMIAQEASAGTFSLDDAALHAWTLGMVKAGRGDEIEEWCSIVHSHPVGVGPSMSGVDVDAIKRYAAEGDAFSLIITAAKDASSKRLYMHYCANVRGNKVIFDDIPVHVGTTTDRLEIIRDVAAFLHARFDLDPSSDDGKKVLAEAMALNSKIPGVWADERIKLAEEAKAFVAKHMTQKVFPVSSGRVRMLTAGSSTTTKTIKPGKPSDINTPISHLPTAELQDIAHGFDPRTGKMPKAKAVRKALAVLRSRMSAEDYNKEFGEGYLSPRDEDDDIVLGVGDMVLITDQACEHVMENQARWSTDENTLIMMTESPCPIDRVDEVGYWVNEFSFSRDELIPATSSNLALA